MYLTFDHKHLQIQTEIIFWKLYDMREDLLEEHHIMNVRQLGKLSLHPGSCRIWLLLLLLL